MIHSYIDGHAPHVNTARVPRGVEFARVARQRLRLDVYHPPAKFSGLRPAVVHVHGGGWVAGSRTEQGIPIMALLSDRGYVCFNISYRLSPGATWPEHLVDVKRAIAWVREHAEEYDVDPSFVAVIGGSAGGHLTAMAALTQHDLALRPRTGDVADDLIVVHRGTGATELNDEDVHLEFSAFSGRPSGPTDGTVTYVVESGPRRGLWRAAVEAR